MQLAWDGNLGQLAAVFDGVARLNDVTDLNRMSETVCQERRVLRDALDRRMAVERKTSETRESQVFFTEELRKAQVSASACRRQLKHLQDELKELNENIRVAEVDIESLHTSSGNADPSSRSFSSHRGDKDILAEVRAERDEIQKECKEIKDLRLRLDRIYTEKMEMQELEGSLLQRQQMIEKDRGLMLTSIDQELSKLNDLRVSRVQILEERAQLEREITDLSQQKFLDDKVVVRSATSRPVSGQRMKGVPYDAVAVLENLPYEPALNRQRGLVGTEVKMLTRGDL
mmetsp:Transcript_11821/g.21553  ORF Transcript_11821/g.21553 Transcript_11821/m.21553 type:complete len:287 (+) Transcript_11821:41-901(+)